MREHNAKALNVLFDVTDEMFLEYRDPVLNALDRRNLRALGFMPGHVAPQDVHYIVHATGGSVDDFRPFINARAILSLWAGVEKIVGNPTLTQPLCRMVDDGLRQGMVEWVVAHVLRAHLGTDSYVCQKPIGWTQSVPPLATERSVSVLGLGELGSAAASALANLGFRVTGWSRRSRNSQGIRCLAGPENLPQALADAEILVLLLPETPFTIDMLDAEKLAMLPRGSSIINAGRGTLVDEDALLAALDSGHVKQATLDVFRIEPLPPDHPFWSHPAITISPHIAAATRAVSAADVIATNIERAETGLPLLHLVNRAHSY